MKRIAFISLFLSCVVLFAIGSAHAQLDTGPWPMFHHDSDLTGRSPNRGPQIPVLSWTYVTDFIVSGDLTFASPTVGSDGRIYFGCGNNKVYALNATGSVAWTYETKRTTEYSCPAIGIDGRIYIGSYDNSLYALNSSGDLSWSFMSEDYAGSAMGFSSPTIGTDGRIYVGSWNRKLYAFTSAGSISWSYRTPHDFSYFSVAPAVGSNGIIYAGCNDDNIYALNSSGSLLWSYDTGYDVMSSPAIGPTGRIYGGSWSNNVFAFNTTGSLQWSYAVGFGVHLSCPAISTNGTIYIGCLDNNLYALTSTGSLVWSYVTSVTVGEPSGVQSSPAIDSLGRIYVGADDNQFYVLSSTGTLEWSYTIGAWLYSKIGSSPAIGFDGLVYIGSGYNRMWAFGEAPRLAIMKEEGVSNTKLYYYNNLAQGDWLYWNTLARNPSPQARDFWSIPIGNDTFTMTEVRIGEQQIAVMKANQGGTDHNFYLYDSLLIGDLTYWDCVSRNPSPLARDFWIMGSGNNTEFIAEGGNALASMKNNRGDYNFYLYNIPVPGDWRYWDALARNPSPLARDFWIIPQGDDATTMCGIDYMGYGRSTHLFVMRNQGWGYAAYLWKMPEAGDWSYWDALARNPSPITRDFWCIPSGTEPIACTGIYANNDIWEIQLAILKKAAAVDINIYYYNTPRNDWTYWDCRARNPSPLARDFWIIPSGNNAVGLTSIDNSR